MEASILNAVDAKFRLKSTIEARIEKMRAYLYTTEGKKRAKYADIEIKKLEWDLRLVNNPPRS